MLKIVTTAVTVLLLWPCADAAAQSEPVGTSEAAVPTPVARAQANDHTNRAGRMVDGELHVEIEAVETEWFPRGANGPRIVTPAFAEVGEAGNRAGTAEIAGSEGPVLPLQRIAALALTDDELLPLVGSYTTPGLPVDAVVETNEGTLTLRFGPGPPARLVPLSRSRFRIEGPGVPPGAQIRFAPRNGRAMGAFVTSPGDPPIPLTRKE